MRKPQLGITLSNLETFENPKVELEQYSFDGQSASEVLWNAFQMGDIKRKVIGDFGCGTGILGIGALLLGAKKVYFIDKCKESILSSERNIKRVEKEQGLSFKGKYKFILGDISIFNKKVDTVIQNPPFGVKNEHADRIFLKKALENSNVIYSAHKTSTLDFLEKFISKLGGKISHIFRIKMQLKSSMKWHKSPIRRIDVSVLRISK